MGGEGLEGPRLGGATSLPGQQSGGSANGKPGHYQGKNNREQMPGGPKHPLPRVTPQVKPSTQDTQEPWTSVENEINGPRNLSLLTPTALSPSPGAPKRHRALLEPPMEGLQRTSRTSPEQHRHLLI